jgi:RNA-binding protein YlmH
VRLEKKEADLAMLLINCGLSRAAKTQTQTLAKRSVHIFFQAGAKSARKKRVFIIYTRACPSEQSESFDVSVTRGDDPKG